MPLSKSEMKEWRSIYGKSRRHHIPVKLISDISKVKFGKTALFSEVYAQLGTGRATEIMNARIKVKAKRGK